MTTLICSIIQLVELFRNALNKLPRLVCKRILMLENMDKFILLVNRILKSNLSRFPSRLLGDL